jgi:hypothetical protein
MAYVPDEYRPIRTKDDIGWYEDGELASAEILNRAINDVADMVLTVVNEGTSKKGIRLASDANLDYATYTANTITGQDDVGTFIASIIDTSTIVNLVTGDTGSFRVGSVISGDGIAEGSVVAEIVSTTQFILDMPATATNASVELTYTQSITLLYIDGVHPNDGDRILLKDQTIGAQNGIYEVTANGSSTVPWVITRSVDGTDWNQFISAQLSIEIGTANADTVWFCTANKDAGVIGTDTLRFQGLGGSGQMLGTAKTRMFSYNSQVLEESVIVGSMMNASAVGPVNIMEGYTVTIQDGARLVIL